MTQSDHTTVGNLMGFLFGCGFFIEGLLARVMYHSLRLPHERAFNGAAYAVLALLSRALSRRTGQRLCGSTGNAAAVVHAGVDKVMLGPLNFQVVLRPERIDLLLTLLDHAGGLRLARDRHE
jgi:hypothetical protein